MVPLKHLTANVARNVPWMALDQMYILVSIRYPRWMKVITEDPMRKYNFSQKVEF
jgi:hypothetical protein